MPDVASLEEVEGTEVRVAAHILAGPVLYALYFTLGYLLVEAGCATSFLDWRAFGLHGEVVVTLALTVITAVPLLMEARVVHRRWQQTRDADMNDKDLPETKKPFIWLMSLMMDLLFLALTVVTGLSALTLQPCTWV